MSWFYPPPHHCTWVNNTIKNTPLCPVYLASGSLCLLLPQCQQGSASPRRGFGRSTIPSRGSWCSCTKSFTSLKYSNTVLNLACIILEYDHEALISALCLLHLQLPPAPHHNIKRRLIERFKKSLFHGGSDPYSLKVELSKVCTFSSTRFGWTTILFFHVSRHMSDLVSFWGWQKLFVRQSRQKMVSLSPYSSSRLLLSWWS